MIDLFYNEIMMTDFKKYLEKINIQSDIYRKIRNNVLNENEDDNSVIKEKIYYKYISLLNGLKLLKKKDEESFIKGFNLKSYSEKSDYLTCFSFVAFLFILFIDAFLNFKYNDNFLLYYAIAFLIFGVSLCFNTWIRKMMDSPAFSLANAFISFMPYYYGDNYKQDYPKYESFLENNEIMTTMFGKQKEQIDFMHFIDYRGLLNCENKDEIKQVLGHFCNGGFDLNDLLQEIKMVKESHKNKLSEVIEKHHILYALRQTEKILIKHWAGINQLESFQFDLLNEYESIFNANINLFNEEEIKHHQLVFNGEWLDTILSGQVENRKNQLNKLLVERSKKIKNIK